MAQDTYHPVKGGDVDARQLTLAGEQYAPNVITGDGAIPIVPGIYHLTKGSAAAITLAAPTAGAASVGGHDGVIITVVSETAFAHVITGSVRGFNGKGSSGTITFGTAKGNTVTLIARNGDWFTLGAIGATVA